MEFIHITKYLFLKSFIFPKVRMHFGMFGLFCIINCYFEYSIRILRIFLYMGTYFKDIFDPQIEFVRPSKIENVPRSVNNFRIEEFWS